MFLLKIGRFFSTPQPCRRKSRRKIPYVLRASSFEKIVKLPTSTHTSYVSSSSSTSSPLFSFLSPKPYLFLPLLYSLAPQFLPRPSISPSPSPFSHLFSSPFPKPSSFFSSSSPSSFLSSPPSLCRCLSSVLFSFPFF